MFYTEPFEIIFFCHFYMYFETITNKTEEIYKYFQTNNILNHTQIKYKCNCKELIC